MRALRGNIFAIALLCCAPVAWAQSTLHIGPGAGTKCAEGCAGDPNLLVGATRVDIYQTSAGAPILSQPVLLIFGVPSEYASRFPLMPILGLKAVNPYPGGAITTGTAAFAAGGTYGLINPVSDGFFGTMMPEQEVYGFLGLSANNSNSFTNWAEADDEYLGLDPTSFDIHVYALNATLGPEGLINVGLVKNVPKGTFIVAFGQGSDGKNYAVPFTEAGLKCTY